MVKDPFEIALNLLNHSPMRRGRSMHELIDLLYHIRDVSSCQTKILQRANDLTIETWIKEGDHH